mgnify:CR=1 FL=1|tara:strand:+ start:144 stop:461 length:318 start_codon:yes stop_codon:yes gene_type:complete
MKITKRQLRRIIREEKQKLIREGTMKQYYGEIQNAILDCCEDNGGKCTVDDCIPYVVEAAPFMNRPGSQYDSLYKEVAEFMHQMAEDAMLVYIGDDKFGMGEGYQ